MSEETQSGGGTGGGDGGGDEPKAKPKPPKARSDKGAHLVPLVPPKREVSDKHLANLRASGLTDETIKLADLYTESNYLTLAQLVQRRAWFRPCGAALVFPFYLPGGTEPVGYRLRPSHPRTEKRGKKTRPIKYDQAEAYGALVYFAPRARAAGGYADAALTTCFWTEGEKKALVFDQLGMLCVGLTGVWMWHDKKHRDESGEERLHPAIREHVLIAGRHHVICFDSDAREKDSVMLAAARLCGVLLAAGALSVKFVCPPTPEQKGIDDYYAAFGEEVTRQLLASASDIEPADPKNPLQRVKKLRALREAPVANDIRVPDGYEVQKDGALWRISDEKHGDVQVARTPILVQRYLDDYYTHDGRVDVCWDRGDRWVSMCVSRRALIETRVMLTELGPYGAPVTSNNAPKMIDWLDAFERTNAAAIPRIACVGRTGWHTIDGARVFVLNEPVFEDTEAEPTLALDTRGDRRKLFDALRPRGEPEQHLDALRRAWDADPVVAAVICGALAAPLLERLHAPNFALHLPGESSRGKTSMLKIGASVYGDPSSEAWVASWDTTSAAAELRAATLNHLPQCYDEVGASDSQQMERMVYMLVNGGGRSRSTRDLSLRETLNWRTVVLSTGERELADESTATGAQIRVIHLPVTGFGNLTAAQVDALREACAKHAGSFGRQWIENMLGVSDWAPFRESLHKLTQQMRDRASDPLDGRVAAYFAVLAVTEAMASQMGLGEAAGATMKRLYSDRDKREVVKGLAERSLDLVRDWVFSEPEAFPELSGPDGGDEKPARSYGGRPLHGFRRAGQIIFIPDQFRAFCAHKRLSHREVLREWMQRDWLVHDHGRLEKEIRIGGKKNRFYVLHDAQDDDGDWP